MCCNTSDFSQSGGLSCPYRSNSNIFNMYFVNEDSCSISERKHFYSFCTKMSLLLLNIHDFYVILEVDIHLINQIV
jgi:hypothetical protein